MRAVMWIGRLSLFAVALTLAAVTLTGAQEKDKPAKDYDAKKDKDTKKDKDEKKDKDKTKEEDREPDCVYVPSPPEVVEKMLEAAKVGEKDVLYDLGCGDGRILVSAAKKYKCKAVGCDI